MILRKPYGFLIKHFRLIHLILFGLSCFLTMKVNSLLKYYNGFIQGSESKLDAISYVTNYYIWFILIAVLICLIVYALMRYKKKPRFLYLLLILLYFITGVMIQVVYEGLHTIYISVLDTKTLLLYRDFLRILIVFQYISLAFLLVRGLGFDIKKFNFVRDLQELGGDEKDSEEIELTLGGTEVTQRKVHRGIRELKYYYLENKVFIHIILIVLVVVGVSFFSVKKEIIDKVYQEGETFSTDNFDFKVMNSYVTNKDYQGNSVGDMEHSFVAVLLSLHSKGGSQVFNSANLILKTKSNSYSPSVRYGDYFKDMGVVYQGQSVDGSDTYLFLYSVLNEELHQAMQLTYASMRTVNLKPIFFEKDKITSVSLNQSIDLGDTVMHGGSFQIVSSEIRDRFSYSYEYEIRDEKFQGQYMIGDEKGAILFLKIVSSYPRRLSDFEFLSNYATLKYQLGDKEVQSSFYDKTPGNYKEGLYLYVDREILEASKVWLEIKIRNSKYIYLLLKK